MADLRDALKFWLEEMGYEVQLSENNDFRRRPEAGTFEACFEQIRHADYYLLLIGSRRGSWYRRTGDVTVTREEYRTAYNSWQESGKPVPIAFVRRDVAMALRERARANAPRGSGSTMQDPEFTQSFLKEVRREDEEVRAVGGRGPYPAANWLTEFANFRELTTTLRAVLRIRGPLLRAAIEENLRFELEHNLRMMASKRRGAPFFWHWAAHRVREEIQLEPAKIEGQVRLKSEHIKSLSIFAAIGAVPPESFNRAAVEDSIISGAFLEYDHESSRYRVSAFLRALYKLREEFAVYEKRYTSGMTTRHRWPQVWQEVRGSGAATKDVPAWDLAEIYALYDSQVNILRLLLTLWWHLDDPTRDLEVRLRPTTPIVGEAELLEEDKPSEAELATWLKERNWLLELNLAELTPDERRGIADRWEMLVKAIGRADLEAILRRQFSHLPEEYLEPLIQSYLGEDSKEPES